jgi:hypothetical protein
MNMHAWMRILSKTADGSGGFRFRPENGFMHTETVPKAHMRAAAPQYARRAGPV